MKSGPKAAWQALILSLALLLCPAPALTGGVVSQKSSPPGTVSSSQPLTLSGYTQLLFEGKNEAADTFSIRRARFGLGGAILKNLNFKIQADLTRSPVLLDALAEVTLNPLINFRAGQFLVPFSLESTTSAGQLLTINRSQAVDRLAPGRDNRSAGRDLGLVVFGSYSIIKYTFGLVNGAGINKKDDNDHKDLAARITFHPLQELAFGFSFYDGRSFEASSSVNLLRNRYGLEFSWHQAPFQLQAEYIKVRDHMTEKFGWYLLGAVDLIQDKYQLLFRLDCLNVDRNLPDQRTTVYTAGANWFLSPMSRMQVNVEYHRVESGPDFKTFLLQLQLGF